MVLSEGTRLGSYEILAPIGAGGMGEVYRARDDKLKRDVAIKVLPEAFASDQQRMARFEREAQLLASLNHPNIGSIYGLDEAEGLRFLVLELVPGDTLADRLKSGPLPISEALELAVQIADALAAAHDKGIIHRDLKPANIKITPDGQIKVLDFGLAKVLVDEPMDSAVSDSPTLSAHATKVGVILGTAGYMSPEQARGKPVDKRTDIFSFGSVLCEMLTGRQLFKGEDAADTMASVIRSDPDWRSLPAELHPRVREALARCLEKDPKKRRRDIGDIRAELTGPYELVQTAERRSRPWLALAGAAVLIVGTAFITWNLKPEAPRLVRRFQIELSEEDTFTGTGRHIVALSPRGTHLVYGANNQFHLRALDQTDAAPIRGTELGREPFFSPDGEWLGFYSEGYLKKISRTGGTPVTLCEAENPYGASWSADGTIVFGQGDAGIWEVSANGGEPRVLVEGGDGLRYHASQKLPDGRAVLFTVAETTLAWDEAAIAVEQLDTKERTILVRGGYDARYVPTGHIVYASRGTLFTVPFDLERREVTGGPVPVLEGVMGPGSSGAAQYSFSDDGSLVFGSGVSYLERNLLWVERNGQTSRLTERVGGFSSPAFSPDGGRLALDVDQGGEVNVWLYDIERDTLTQLTTGASDHLPSWSPDGEEILFTSESQLFRIRTDFSRAAEEVWDHQEGRLLYYPRWLPDGKGLVFQESTSSDSDLWLLALEDDAEPHPLLQTTSGEAQPDLSPDGRFIVYHSDVSGGTNQIFVQPFPGPGSRRQISTDGGRSPRWSPTGREIFYQAADTRSLMAVAVRTEPELDFGTPVVLFEQALSSPGRNWDVTPDGQRFVVATAGTADESRSQITFVLNWFDELERLVPTGN